MGASQIHTVTSKEKKGSAGCKATTRRSAPPQKQKSERPINTRRNDHVSIKEIASQNGLRNNRNQNKEKTWTTLDLTDACVKTSLIKIVH